MKAIAFAILITFFLVGCNESSTDKSNSYDGDLIEKEEFIKIFAEAQLIESHISILRVYQPYYKDSVDNYYQGLFDKYNVNSESFYYSLKEYTKDPEEMNEIVVSAIAHLKDEETKLGNVESTKPNLNALSRQQIGDIIYESPFKDMMIDGTPVIASIIRDSLFNYLDSFPDVVTKHGYSIESVRFTFVLNTNNSVMFNQLKEYVKNKVDKEKQID